MYGVQVPGTRYCIIVQVQVVLLTTYDLCTGTWFYALPGTYWSSCLRILGSSGVSMAGRKFYKVKVAPVGLVCY